MWRSAPLTAVDLGLLTPAEQRVLALAADGLSVREIAQTLVLTEATIHSHLSHIYAKLGVRGRVGLLAKLAADSQSDRQEPPVPPARTALLPGLVASGLLAVASLAAGLVVPISSPAVGPTLLLVSWAAWRRLPKRLRWTIAPIAFAGILLSMEGLAVLLVVRVP
jgi:DNA-binding CsgD family transcriptional regulator